MPKPDAVSSRHEPFGHNLGDHVGLAGALEGMGNSALALEHYGEARRYLREALQMIHDRMLPRTLSVFVGIGDLLLKTGRQARGVELLVFVLHNAIGYQDTKERAQRLLTRYRVKAKRHSKFLRQGILRRSRMPCSMNFKSLKTSP